MPMSLIRDLLIDTTPNTHRARAAVGGLAGAAGVALTAPGWGAGLLLLAPLVAVPLGLALLPRQAGALWRVAASLQLPAALLLLAGLALPAGPVAACFTLPWFVVTALLALVGAGRLWTRGLRPVEQFCVSAGLMYLAVGGGWTVLTALGARPLDFPGEIVRATAVHFHYAGFVLPLLAARTAGASARRLAGVLAVGVVVGVPLVAVGITLSAFGVSLPECLAACALAAVTAALAVLQMRVAVSLRGMAARGLLALSGLALLAGMALAALYAVGNYAGARWLDIPLMLRTHGVINACGFALCGLLAWNLDGAERKNMDWVWRVFGRRPRLERWEGRPFSRGAEQGPREGDARDCHERVVTREEPGPPAADGPYRRLAEAILRYDIFPPSLVEPVRGRVPVEVGDTVGVCYRLMPGLALFFAARVTARFDEADGNVWRTGFTYRTLEGHPKCGEETFSVEKDMTTGAVRVALRSWSRPALWLDRLLAFWTRRLQLQAGRAALDHLASTQAATG
jgi:hypothetical protein